MPTTDEENHKKQYLEIFQLFKTLVEKTANGKGRQKIMEEIMALRADFAIQHAVKGFNMEFEDAIELLRTETDLTPDEKAQRDILILAIDNIIDFAVAEEYQMIEELDEMDLEDIVFDEEGDFPEEDYEELVALCGKYNDRYALVENLDIEYAMIMAAFLVSIEENEMLMYMTMGDERVRPWHLLYEGYEAPKKDFPAWLVPPIEHGCRCFLVTTSANAKAKDVVAKKLPTPEMPEWFNPTFKECVGLGGRIFSDEHPYFTIKKKDIKLLNKLSKRIKKKYLVS